MGAVSCGFPDVLWWRNQQKNPDGHRHTKTSGNLSRLENALIRYHPSHENWLSAAKNRTSWDQQAAIFSTRITGKTPPNPKGKPGKTANNPNPLPNPHPHTPPPQAHKKRALSSSDPTTHAPPCKHPRNRTPTATPKTAKALPEKSPETELTWEQTLEQPLISLVPKAGNGRGLRDGQRIVKPRIRQLQRGASSRSRRRINTGATQSDPFTDAKLGRVVGEKARQGRRDGADYRRKRQGQRQGQMGRMDEAGGRHPSTTSSSSTSSSTSSSSSASPSLATAAATAPEQHAAVACAASTQASQQPLGRAEARASSSAASAAGRSSSSNNKAAEQGTGRSTRHDIPASEEAAAATTTTAATHRSTTGLASTAAAAAAKAPGSAPRLHQAKPRTKRPAEASNDAIATGMGEAAGDTKAHSRDSVTRRQDGRDPEDEAAATTTATASSSTTSRRSPTVLRPPAGAAHQCPAQPAATAAEAAGGGHHAHHSHRQGGATAAPKRELKQRDHPPARLLRRQ